MCLILQEKAHGQPTASDDNQTPTVLYNGMIAPLVPFNFAGVCWYQGETNVGRAKQLTELFPAMIEGWRSDFQKNNLPFYFVQLAPYAAYGEQSLFEFWEAQAYTLNLHHTEMAETLDLGDAENIHPAKKEPIGNRLAQKALANVYRKSSIVYAGPRYDSLRIEGNKIRLFFSHTGSGLKTVDSVLKNFEIAGSNNYFYPAQAEISGNEVLVSSSLITSPKNVRYAYLKNASASLYNNEGFPAIPFRTNPASWIESVKSTFIIGSELINEGENVELKWTTIGAKQVVLNGENVAPTNTILVSPDSTTTYTLIAKSETDSVAISKTVYVVPKELKSWAKNKIVKVSSTRAGFKPKYAVDEIMNSSWSSNYTNNEWISVDLGEKVPVKLVVLHWNANFGKAYEIQVSDDAQDWKTIFSETKGNGGIDFIANLQDSGRYVRMSGIARSGSAGYDLAEFKVYTTEHRLTGSLKDKNGNIMRGTPMVLGKNLGASVAFASDIKNWETIKNSGYNTIRVCWVDPWYKDHEKTYWNVAEVLPHLDKCVENANKTGMNIIINFHGVGSQQDFDKEYTFSFEKEFWKAVAPRYKDNDLVYYEIANEPTFQMEDYLKPAFKRNLMEIYHSIRNAAPDRHIMMFSFNTIIDKIIDVVEGYKSEIDWNTTSVAYHMYNYKSSEYVVNLMAYHRAICTEWNYDFVGKKGNFAYIQQVDGYKENSQTLEAIGSSWVDWRDWGDITLDELLDTTYLDAVSKNYWWGEPIAGLKVSELHISDNKIELKSGQSKKISAWVLPALAENQKITWSSSNNDFATVNENGVITATATQTKIATITATSADGNFTKSCEVKIIAPEKKGAYPDGGAHHIPGTINPTFYDLGGEGIGYHDLNAGNAGDGIRQEQGVDTEFRLSEGSIGGIQTGEWLEYTIDVEKEGFYDIEILFATPGSFGKFHIEFDAEDKTGLVFVKPSQGYSTFKPTKIENIGLKQGVQIMRIYFEFAIYNMGTISIVESNTTATNDFNTNNWVKIYPNPATDKLYISSRNPIENYKIQTLTGQTILQGTLTNKLFVDIRSLIKGCYLVCLTRNNNLKTSTFIKL